MRKILSVIKREYLQIVKTKGFIIGTVLGPVLMVALIVVPILGQLVSVGKQETIGVIDLTQEIFAELDKKLDYKLKDGTRRYILEEFKPTASVENLRNAMSKKVLEKELSAYIFIPDSISEGGEAQYVSLHTTDFDEIKNIHSAINSVVIEKRLKKEGLDPAKVSQYLRPVKMTPVKVTKKGEEKDIGATFLISYLLVLILYMTLFFYGAIIMRGVIEEKSSRVVEVILSSLKPFQLMMGKILGIGAVGLTQYSIWALFGFAASRYSKSLISSFVRIPADFSLPRMPAYIFIYFVIFFLLGYFLYATFYAAIGSMVDSEKEAQQLLFPVTMFLVIPILMIMFVVKNPESTFAVVLSMIPFFAPIIMLMRVCILLPPFIQIGGSILLLILAILLMVWLTAKIYRVGILMYGKRPSLAEIVKWIRYK